MKVLCIGSIMCDVAFSPIEPGNYDTYKSIIADKFSLHGGGEGNNASMDLATLGEEVRLVARSGNDFIGDHLLEELNKKGVCTDYVVKCTDTPTTISVQMISSVGARTLAAKRWGATETLQADDVPDELIAWADHVHIVGAMCLADFDGKGSAQVFRRAHELGKTTSMDLNNPRTEGDCFHLFRDALYNCDLFIPSSYEIERACGLTDMNDAREFFREYGLKALCVKRSELGAYIMDYENEKEYYLPSLLEGDPVDVVGAGDAFASTFASAYKRGYNLRACGMIASAASAHVLSSLGATSGMRDFDTLLAFAKARGALEL